MPPIDEVAVTNPEGSDASGMDDTASAFDTALGLKDEPAVQTTRQRAAPATAAPPATVDDPNEDDDDPDALTPEGDEEGEPGPDDEGEDDPEFEIPVNGKTEKVKLSKLREDFGKGADYTQKTQALAKDREVLYNYANEAKAEREAFKARAMELDATVKALEPSAEDWAALRTVNPQQYADAKDNWAKINEKRDAMLAQVQKAQEEDQKAAAVQYNDWVNQENERLKSTLPVLFDKQKGQSVRDRIFKYGESVGYSRQQLAQAVDHREVLTLYKAMRFDEIQAAKNKGQTAQNTRNTPRPQIANGRAVAAQQPGNRAAAGRKSDVARAQDTLSKTGRMEDAAAAFTAMLRS